jgi:hypothetical protein
MLEKCIREFPGSISDQDIDHQDWEFRCFSKSTQVNANTVLGSNVGTVKIFFFKKVQYALGPKSLIFNAHR